MHIHLQSSDITNIFPFLAVFTKIYNFIPNLQRLQFFGIILSVILNTFTVQNFYNQQMFKRFLFTKYIFQFPAVFAEKYTIPTLINNV